LGTHEEIGEGGGYDHENEEEDVRERKGEDDGNLHGAGQLGLGEREEERLYKGLTGWAFWALEN